MRRAAVVIAIVMMSGACKKPAASKASSECAIETVCTKVASDGGVGSAGSASGSNSAPH